MSLKIEIIRSVFKEIKRNFKYSLIEAEAIDRNIEKEKVKACELPFKSFMDKKGMSLQCSMAMIYMLRRNGIKSFLGVYMGEGLYTDEQKSNYAFVIYLDGFKIRVADFEPIEERWKITDPSCIPISKYRKIRGKMWIYDPYSPKTGNLPFFGGFLEKWIWKF